MSTTLEAPVVVAAPHEARVCRVPRGWFDTGLTICRRCERVTDIATLESHNHVHDIADARLRGETLTTPARMVASRFGVKEEAR